MKKLILLSLFPSVLWAGPVGPEIVSHETGKEIAATIKDIEVKEMLAKTSQFNDCRKKNVFSSDGKDRDKKIVDAQNCFKQQISQETELKKLSETLNLQNYGLIKSNTVKDIQNYLNDKMYEVMTGVNLKEANHKKLMESLKFKNKKQIDQSIFITLYKAQLSKNALYEISRYCFEDLRYNDPNSDTPTSFGAYWLKKGIDEIAIEDFNDRGKPVFGEIHDVKDKAKIYQDLFQSMNIGGDKGFPVNKLSDFFQKCGVIMVAQCERYKENKVVTDKSTSDVDVDESKTEIPGAASCLAKDRLQTIKKALVASDLIEKEFEKMSPTDLENALLATEFNNKKYKLFEPGPGDTSIDSLTNHSSAEIIEGGLQNNSQFEQREKACLEDPTDPKKCEGFVTTGDGFEKAKHDIEMEMTLKRQVEVERIKKLQAADKVKFKEYLEQNGYFTLLKTAEKGDISDKELEDFITNEFEAKKVAMLSEINSKIGKRQVKKDSSGKEVANESDVKAVIKETKEERARLAQVVLFNNIITSYLTLNRVDDKGKSTPVGRNVNAWKKEEQALSKASVDSGLFANLKAKDDPTSGGGLKDGEKIGGADLIDQILGKETKKP